MFSYEDIKDEIKYFPYRLKHWYYGTISWFRYHFNKGTVNLIKTILTTYPYDFCFLYRIEKAKLQEMLNYYEKSNIMSDEKKEQVVRTLKLAISLINIINEDGIQLFHYDGKMEFIDEGNGLHRCDTSNLHYHSDVKVNLKNANRYGNDLNQKIFNEMPHELYVMKAKHLYYKLRLYYTDLWWD